MHARNKTLRSVLTGGCAVLAAVAVSACGSSTGNDSDKAAPTKTTTVKTSSSGVPDLHGVSLTVWEPPTMTAAQKTMMKDFQTQTGAKLVERVFPVPFESNLLTKWATGDRPDLMFWHAIGNWLVQLNPEQNLEDLSSMSFVDKTEGDYLSKSSTFKGKVYAPLLNFPSVDGYIYNKKVFEKLGLETPKTYDDLISVCKAIRQKDPGIDPVEMGGGDQFPLQIPAFMMWNDAIKADPDLMQKVNEGKAKFSDPTFVKGIQQLQGMQKAGCFNKDVKTATFVDQGKRTLDGKGAMSFFLTDIINLLVDSDGVEKVDANLGFASMSDTDGSPVGWQTAGTDAVFVPKGKDAKNVAAAKAFIDWMTGPYYQTYIDNSKVFPILKGATTPDGIPTAHQEARRILEADPVPQFQQTLQATYGAFEKYLADMIAGRMSPQDVGDKLQSEFEQSAQQMGLPGF
jgi:raffinose/stachyose/melibiose transport system substrate-binding protein